MITIHKTILYKQPQSHDKLTQKAVNKGHNCAELCTFALYISHKYVLYT